MEIEHLPTNKYLEQVTPSHSPSYLSVLNNNSFVYMEL